MARISYTVAKDLLTEVEKNRLVACYLAIDKPNDAVDFDLAAQEYGAASTESFKKMISTAFKKVEGSVALKDLHGLPKTPKAKTAAARKRKSIDNDGDNADDQSPTAKKGRKKGVAKKVQRKSSFVVSDVSEDEADLGDASLPTPAGSDDFQDNITLNTESNDKGTD